MKILGPILLANTCWCTSLAPDNAVALSLGSPVLSTIEASSINHFKLSDIPSDRTKGSQLFISLSVCSVSESGIQDSPDLFYRIGGTINATFQEDSWKESSVHDTFETINPSLVNLVKKKSYADYYFGYRVAVVDLATLKQNEPIYLAVRNPNKDAKIRYQLGYSNVGFPDFLGFNFTTQLLDTSDRAASFLANNRSISDFDSAVFYYTEFHSSRRFNSICSILATGKVSNLTANTKHFKPSIKYMLPTEKEDQQNFFYEVYLDGLKADTAYVAWLTIPASSGMSGITYPPVYFRTKKKNPSCFLVRNLDFCDSVYHSVYLPEKTKSQSNIPKLELAYLAWADANIQKRQKIAIEKFELFEKALDQYDCKNHLYSNIRDCTDCAASYKAWICALSFPKCADEPYPSDSLSDSPLFLDPDGLAPPIVKQCAFMCHYVMQDCPSSLNFRCPGKINMNQANGTYFPTDKGIASWAEYQLQVIKYPFSSNTTPPIQKKPFCNAMLSPLRIPQSDLVFKASSQEPSFSSSLSLIILLVLNMS
ncbi:stretch-activated cation channel mid1 [Entomophthora muscae]|uniref:Stretch-activated cation channel mid1 n=1 Tax=Entomophthora muscae TaxID=34485 RepID=A0ACC2S0C3_9FUNG|nr:stretch-activated cation channel mid1 [Entomophthora muscae]